MSMLARRIEEAEALLARGEVAAAQAAAQLLQRQHPSDPGVCMLLSLIALRERRLDQALFFAQRTRDLARGHAEPWMQIGICEGELRRTDRALAAFEQALTIDPASARARAAVLGALTDVRRYAEAERVAREWIAARFPGDGIMGEEFGESGAGARRRWILDPIDGTKAFVRGVPLWGTLVACCEGDTVLAGAACYPAVGELVVAAPGEGCWWNGARAQVSNVSALNDATVLVTDDRFVERPARGAQWHALAAQAAVARTWGDCFGYLLVATGRADVMVDDIVNPWDAAALQPIITEAGGVFTAWNGHATAFGGSAIATNRALAERVRTILQEST